MLRAISIAELASLVLTKPSKNTSGSYQNQGYHEDEGTSQQTNV